MAYTVFKGGLSCLMAIAGAIAGIGFGLLAFVVVVDLLTRNLGLASWPWLNEVTEYLITIATFFGAPWVLHQSAHVNVDVLLRIVGPGAAAAMMKLANLAGVVISLGLAYLALSTLIDSRSAGALVFKNLFFPEWYLMLPMVWCFVLCGLEFLSKLVEGENSL